MAKLTATILATMAGTASAFAPATTRTTSSLNAFANGMVGGEGPEPMPFNFGSEKTAKNFDPVGFSEVSWLLRSFAPSSCPVVAIIIMVRMSCVYSSAMAITRPKLYH